MFRFTIRDVLWLTVVVAVVVTMGMGWWADHRRLVTEYRRLWDTIEVVDTVIKPTIEQKASPDEN